VCVSYRRLDQRAGLERTGHSVIRNAATEIVTKMAAGYTFTSSRFRQGRRKLAQEYGIPHAFARI
jgi:hypothetical protein